MNKVLAKRMSETVKKVEAPSKIVYTINAQSSGAYLAALGCVPSFRSAQSKEEDIALTEIVAMQQSICRSCVVAMEYKGEETTDVGDPVDWFTDDVTFVSREIQAIFGVDAKSAATAREVLTAGTTSSSPSTPSANATGRVRTRRRVA